MKQRMFNTFMRIFKNRFLAELLSRAGYVVLVCFYMVRKLFLRKKSSMTAQKAREQLNQTSPKPDMDCEISNQEAIKDLSIIVPAYNAQSTIEDCIRSVLCQNTKYDYELIIVNDGSTDHTKAVVEQIKDTHIRLITQENRGFSGARNRGIDECIGKHIMFLDSDDCLVGNCIEDMMDKLILEQADIVQGSYYSFVETQDNRQESRLESRIIESDTSEMVRNPGFPWAKIYKRELFSQIRFPLDVWFEDTIVCMLLYRLCRKMVVMDEMVYAYRINPEGITKKARHSKKCVDHYWVMEYVLQQAEKIGLPKDDIQYRLVSGHMSTLLYRRVSLMESHIVESTFILACDLLDAIRPEGYVVQGGMIEKDIERSFRIWKLASFVV